MARVEINDDGIERVAREAVERWAAAKQPTFDRIHQSHHGKPVEEVKAALKMACLQEEITPDDEQLQSWAAEISAGERIVLRPVPEDGVLRPDP